MYVLFSIFLYIYILINAHILLCSGGTSFLVKGNDLDTVQEPRLLFYKQKETSNNNGTIQKRNVSPPDQDTIFDLDNPIKSDVSTV